MKDITSGAILAIHRNLCEFGYTPLTVEEVKDQVALIKSGGKLSIIGMFAKSMLLENGYLDAETEGA